ncbi:MAG: hypothetical protein AB7I52_19205 [Rhizobiaceae bacterium]
MLLLPTGYYLFGGAAAVIASFLALVALPATLPESFARLRATLFAAPQRGRVAVSLLSFLCFAVLIAAGFLGSRDPLSNPLPLTIWTLLWIGLTLVQGLIGNVWAWINPWYGPWRLLSVVTGIQPKPLPAWVGYWPAVVLFFGFAWFELIDPAPDDPRRLAIAATAYFAGNLIAMTVFGHDAWARRGECLSAFFNLVSRFAIVGRDAGGRVALGLPGAKLAHVEPLPPSGVLFLLLALASVSFDGFARTFTWMSANGINPLEFPGRTALIATNTAGLAGAFVLLSGVFFACVVAGERLAGGRSWRGAAGLLVWSIVPIALAYHFAHYLTALLVNGQYALVALSDPFGLGWDLFGTAGWQVTPGMIVGADSAWVLWNSQAGAIIAGHVLAVLVAHMLAARRHATRRQVALSQLPLTLLMVAYTVFGLWLLSTPTAA